MNIDRIKRKTTISKLSFFQTIHSTNRYLLEHGECKEVCISNQQSAGRGRRGNTWVSPDSGNLYFSLCWCFDSIPQHWSLLGLVVGVAIAETLEVLGLKGHGIKWPNDIFWQQAKMGGILLETTNQNAKVVIGIGLNLHLSQKDILQIDQAAVSLDEAMKEQAFSKNELVITLIKRLCFHLERFKNLNIERFIESWKHWNILAGQTVSIMHQGKKLKGEIIGIDNQGRIGFIEARFHGDKNKAIFFTSADIKIQKP